MTLRQETLPAVSVALMVTAFKPTRSGIVADQLVVPEAVPDWPVLVAQVTEATPAASLEVPEKVIDDAEVSTEVEDGDRMVSAGGVVPVGALPVGVLPEGGFAGGAVPEGD